MIDFDPIQRRLDISPDQLTRFTRHIIGRGSDTPASEFAALTRDGHVHPVAAGIALVATAPDRAIAIERLTDDTIEPLMIGWHRSGRATLTEHHASVPDGDRDGHLSITATHVELLPALVLQAIGLHPDQPPAARQPIETTAGIIDDAVIDLAAGGVAGSLAASDDLLAVMRACERIVRATGSWQGAAADSSVTLLLAGTEGVWLVDRGASGDPADAADRSAAVRIEPIDAATATARLGDVVTGRTAPHPASRTAPRPAPHAVAA
jgi:hypothetical protein